MLRSKRAGLFYYFTLSVVLSFFLVQGNERLRAGDETGTLENLLTAYNDESNTYNLYRAFSQKAEEEGALQAAYLFRAILRSIRVQVDNHAEAVKKMNGTPKSDPETPGVGSTAENLKTALKKESAKFNDLYPAFITTARRERNRTAIRTFNFAKSAAAGHITFLTDALSDPEAWEKKDRTFHVCVVCGNLVTGLNFDECPICFNPLDKYVQVK